MRGFIGLLFIGCADAEPEDTGAEPEDTGAEPEDTGAEPEDEAEAEALAAAICAQSGIADRTLDPSDPIVADGFAFFVGEPVNFDYYWLDPNGEKDITLFYDGGNTVTALYLEGSGEEWNGEDEGEWADCPGLRVRTLTVPDGETVSVEVTTAAWLLAIPSDRLPDDLLR